MASVQDVLSPITISNFGKTVVDGIAQNNPFWKLLKSKGQIERNVSGDLFTWNLEAARYPATITSDDEDVTSYYTPKARYQRPQLNWGQVAVFTRFSKGILRQNNGAQALVKLRDTEIPAMFRDALFNTNGIHYQILNQAGSGYTGTGLPIFGLPSVFSSVTWSATSKDGVITSGTTYAGLACGLSGLVGSVDGAQKDAWTPTAVNSTSTAWANTTGAFAPNAFEVLSYAITKSNRFSASDTSLRATMGLLDQTMLVALGRQIENKQTYFISDKIGADAEQGLGSNTMKLWHGGIPFYWDEKMPANTGYVTNLNQMGLKVQPLVEWGKAESGMMTDGDDSDWFEVDTDFNSSRRSITVSATFPGQFWFNPRYLTQIFAGA